MHDSALIKQAQNGDVEAFKELLSIHYDSLYKFAYRWCGSRVDAEDITQQACIKIARSIRQYRFDAAFSSWLYRLVINCAKDWQRSQKKHASESDGVCVEEQPELVSDVAENELLTRQILEQLEKMPDGMKETIMLVHGEGYSHSEAALILEVKEGTISWRLHEVRKQLRLMFDREALYD